MRIKLFAVAFMVFLTISCVPRMDEREPRYNPKECPFCLTHKGLCTYCDGTAKCTFCNGTGMRTTVSPETNIENPMRKQEYTDTCVFCNGSGVCRYCKGDAKCWVCDGSTEVDTNWSFFQRYKNIQNQSARPEESRQDTVPAQPEDNNKDG